MATSETAHVQVLTWEQMQEHPVLGRLDGASDADGDPAMAIFSATPAEVEFLRGVVLEHRVGDGEWQAAPRGEDVYFTGRGRSCVVCWYRPFAAPHPLSSLYDAVYDQTLEDLLAESQGREPRVVTAPDPVEVDWGALIPVTPEGDVTVRR